MNGGPGHDPLALRSATALSAAAPPVHARGAYAPWPQFGGGGDVESIAFAEARRLMEESRAQSTRRRYEKDWAMYVRWVARTYPAQPSLPARPALIGLYIGVLRTQGLAKQTILGRLAAIAYAHELTGEPSPLKTGDLYRQIRGLRRQVEKPRQAREAIVREDATLMLERWSAPSSLGEIRDRAIFTLTWCSALRRSNIAALQCDDVKLLTDPIDGQRYLEIFVVKSKTDQEGRGRRVIVTQLPGGHPLCAVRALEAWLRAARIESGPLFRAFALDPNPKTRALTSNAIDGRDVTRAVKRIAASAGIDPTKFAAHSLRRGFVTSADAAGVRRSLIREQGGWKDDRMISVYTKVENVRENALRDMFAERERPPG
jgi:site-specific recombinase XerD